MISHNQSCDIKIQVCAITKLGLFCDVIFHDQFSIFLTKGNNVDLVLPGSVKNGIWHFFWFDLVDIG